MTTERIPVRARTRTTFSGHDLSRTDIGCWFLSAGIVTGGTVLVSDWPDSAPPSATAFLDAAADMGAYVVDAPDGLSVTTRSTSGVLQGTHVRGDAGTVLPLLLVLAAAASTPSEFEGVDVDDDDVAALREAGARIAVSHATTRVTPAPLHGVRWTAASPIGAMAGMVLSLIVDEMTVDVGPLKSVTGLLPEWDRVLHADEYLLPGSALLPHDYLDGPHTLR